MSDVCGPTLKLYFRQNCHLCEDMWAHLLEIKKEWAFQIAAIDISADAALEVRHGVRIPVLETEDGNEICNYYLDERGLIEYLDDQLKSQDGLKS